jgi:hypothetical protein
VVKKLPRIILPGPPPDELWVPSSARGLPMPSTAIPPDLPPELRPDQRFIVIQRGEPEDPEIVMARCSPTIEDLDFEGVEIEPPTVEDVIGWIEEIPFEAAMTHLFPIAAEVYHHDHDRERQIVLAQRVYGNSPLMEKIVAFVEEEESHVAFDERYIVALQRLLIEHAADSTDDLTQDQHYLLLQALFAMGSILVDDSPTPPVDPDHPTSEELEAWVYWTLRTGVYYEQTWVLEAAARAYGTLIEAATDPSLAQEAERYPFEEWLCEDHDGVGLRDQLAAGLAVAIGSRVVDPDLSLEDRLQHHIERGFLPADALAGREDQVLASVSATREEFRQALRAAGMDPLRLAWDRTPFEQRPFLRLGNGRLQPLSPRMVISWFTDGLYFRLLDSARRRRHQLGKDRDLVLEYTAFHGKLSERNALRLVEESLSSSITAGAADVHGEIEYWVGRSRKDSSDILIVQPPNIVAIEVFSGRIPLPGRISASPDEMDKALAKMMVGKFDELHRVIDALLDGKIDAPDLDLAEIRTVWPVVLLTGHGLLSTPYLWGYLRRRLADNPFTDPRVGEPTLCDLSDWSS